MFSILVFKMLCKPLYCIGSVCGKIEGWEVYVPGSQCDKWASSGGAWRHTMVCFQPARSVDTCSPSWAPWTPTSITPTSNPLLKLKVNKNSLKTTSPAPFPKQTKGHNNSQSHIGKSKQNEASSNTYQCDICDEIFNMKGNLTKHRDVGLWE